MCFKYAKVAIQTTKTRPVGSGSRRIKHISKVLALKLLSSTLIFGFFSERLLVKPNPIRGREMERLKLASSWEL